MKNLRGGFTLLEIMLSMAVLALLTGGVYAVLHGTFEAVDGLYGEQEKQISDASLAELLRRNFAALPGDAILTLKVRPHQGATLTDLIMENSPGAFSWGRGGWHYGLTVLTSEMGSDGLIRLGIAQIPENSPQGAASRSILLAEGFQEFRWEFYSVRQQRWMGQWLNGGEHPALARVLYRRQDEAVFTEMTFAFPWSSPNQEPLSNQNG